MINENEIKNKVLQELIDLMDSKMVDGLKSKSQKFAKVEVEAQDPESLEDGLDKAKDLISSEESPLENKMDESEDEDLERLRDLYSKIK